MKLLFELLDSFGISGSEQEVRNIIEKEIRPYVDKVFVDNMGNLIAYKKGSRPRVMLAAHMDEVGLMVKRITEKGVIYCTAVGGVTIDGLIGQRVNIRTRRGLIRGILTTLETSSGKDIKKLPEIEDFFVDTGLDKGELEKLGVEIGAYLNFESQASHLGSDKIISGKALDDRVGCYILIELAKRLKNVKHEIYFVFTVQEEVGLYGAQTSTFHIEPDWGIAVETTHANDIFEEPTRVIGNGPCITIKDGEFIANSCINGWLIDIAKKNKIPHQLEATEIGTTDATRMSVTKGGVPSTVVSIPIRNIHTTVGIAHKNDIDNAIRLLELLLRKPPLKCVV